MSSLTGSYASIPDFIYGITREIWEDRGIGGKLERYYAPDILLRAATGLTDSNAGVTAQTLQTLHQFPDRQLVGEDVIWTQPDEASFLSSHRLISVMRHQGDGSYGPASGRLVKSRIIADCWVLNTVVTEEWLVRDQAGFARCIGIEPRQLAQQMVDHDLRTSGQIGFFLPEHDRPGRYQPQIQAGAVDPQRHRQPRPRPARPRGAALVVARHACRVRPLRPTHRAPVYIMGFSHAFIVDGRITFEWLLIDEVVVWKQIIAHLGSRAGA